MNLLIYVDYDLLIFFNHKEKNITQISEFNYKQHLYFFFDRFSNSVKINKNYKMFFLDKKQDFYGDILDNIQKKSTFKVGSKNFDYSFFIQNIFDKLSTNYEQVKIIPAANIEKTTLELLENIVKQKFQNVTIYKSFAEYSVKNFILANIQQQNDKICVVESFSDNIYISKGTINNNVFEISDKKELKQKIFNPKKYAFAKHIVEEIYRIYNPKQIEGKLDENIEYLYLRLKDDYEKMLEQPKEYISVNAKLLADDQRFVVKIQPSKLDVLTELYIKNITAEIQKNLDNETKVIFVGELFDNNLIKNKLDEIKNDIFYYKINEVLSVLDKEIVAEDEYATVFMPIEEETEESNFKAVNSVEISTLKAGNSIKLTNYDARKGKGYSTQILEFVEENKFVVIESSRSLKTGDLVEAEVGVWHSGIELVFNVFRGGKKYGRFKTREIQTIEISEQFF